MSKLLISTLPKRERHYKHVLESVLNSELSAGLSFDEAYSEAKEIAARTVNKFRSRSAGRRGPRLISDGGGRQQWYPGKKTARAGEFSCLEHDRTFVNKTKYIAHLRRHAA